MRFLWPLLAFCLLGCEDSFREESVPLPQIVRSTIPADGAENIGTGEIQLSITFRRPPDIDRLPLNVYPPVRDVGHPSQSGRTLTWEHLDLEPGPTSYVFVLDGPTLDLPYKFRCFPAAAPENHGRFAGTIRVPGADATGTLVLAFSGEDQNLEPAHMLDLARTDPVAATVSEVQFDGGSPYLMEYLEIGRVYIAVAIVDTSGDGRYDVLDDVWGYLSAELGEAELIEAAGVERIGGRPTEAWTTDNDIDVILPEPNP